MKIKLPDDTIVELTVEQFAQGLREGWVTFDDLGCFGPDDSWLPVRQALASNKLPSWGENLGVMAFLDAPRAYAHEYAWRFRYIFAFALALGAYFLTCLTWLDLSISLSLVLLVVSVISLLVVLMIESPGAKLRYGLLGCGILLLIASLGDTELDAVTFYLRFAFALFVASAIGAVLGAIVGHISGTGVGMVVGHARRDRYQLPQARTAVPEWVSVVTSDAIQPDRSILPDAGSSIHEAINMDTTLLDGLTSSNWDEYLQTRNRVMDLGSQQALALVEGALARLAGRSNLRFHRPGGMLVRSPGASEDAYRQIVQLAVDGQLLADPAATQRLIVMVGNALNSPLMDELDNLGGRALQTYQLLGLQMQLRIMAG